MVNLFPGATLANGIIKIPKSALPGLSNPANITAGQFFASVLVRGVEFFPSIPTWQGTHKVSLITSSGCYVDFSQNRLVATHRIQAEFLSGNWEALT